MIQNPDENKELYAKMAKLYIAEDIEILYDYMDDFMDNDIEILYDFMDDFMDNDIEMLKKFLDERNNKWIPEIAKFSKEHSVFYGFGAGHLGGKQGVVNLLKEAGYTVTPVLD
jgi:hypothetical protein